MKLILHEGKNYRIAELEERSFQINDYQDALDLMANANCQDSIRQIIYADDLHQDFFTLSSGIAGEILQKYSNYNNKLAIIGDFSDIKSKSLRDFIYESNNGSQIFFVANRDEAINKLDRM